MTKKGGISISIVNHHMISIAISRIAGCFHGAIGRCINRGSLRGGKIESCMELGRFINRVYPVPKTRSDSFQVFITNRLNGWCAGEQLFLVFYKTIDFIVGFCLRMNPVPRLSGNCR